MRWRWAWFLVLPLLAPVAPMQAAPIARPPGRTVVISATGLPAGSAARVRLKGPKKYAKTIIVKRSKTLRRLRPGIYRATAKPVSTQGRTWIPTVSPTKARVTARKGYRIVVRYQADPIAPQPPCDPALEPCPAPEQPTQPFPVVGAPAGIALVSATPAGTPGSGRSRYATWSPDNQALVFGSCASDLTAPVPGCWLYARDLAGSTTTRLPGTRLGDDLEWGGEPDWAADGSRLSFVSSYPLAATDTDTNSDVYVIPASGGTAARLSQSPTGAGLTGGPYPAQARDPRWAPDSASVMFRSGATNLVVGDGDEWVDLFVGGAADRVLTRLPQGVDVGEGRWSPNGTRVAFTSVSSDEQGSVLRDVRVVGVDGSGGAAVTTDGQSAQPTWSPAGDRIAFASSTPTLVAGDTNEASDIFVRDLSGGAITRISVAADGSESTWSSTGPVWSPDGRRLAFVADSSDNGMVVMVKDLVTGSLTQVTPGGNRDDCDNDNCDTTYFESVDPVWSHDGLRLAFTSNNPNLVPGDDNNNWDVFVATL
ncbi:MAG: hypothetical protein V9E98_01245 [Candidatus Nanopelagicales bacterium]